MRRLLYLVPLVLALNLVSVGAAQIEDGSLAAWWRLDEGNGTNVSDASGGGNDGTLTGGAEWAKGINKTGVCLDGVDDFIGVPNVLTETSTIAFWFKPDWDGTDSDDYRLFDASLGGIYFFISKGANHADINPEEFGFYLEDASDADYQAIEFDPAGIILADTWFHVAVTWEFGGGSAVLYFNGEEMARADSIGAFPDLDPTLRFGFETYTYIPLTYGAMGVIDEIMIYSRALTAEEIPLLMVVAPAELASNPSPSDEATDVLRDLTLGWEPGEFATKHDVYLGTSADDVNGANRGNPLDVLVSQDQETEIHDAGRLAFGQTYCWRVDEVNDTPDNSIFTGEIWSFTVEPFARPIDNITTTASSSFEGYGPQNTVDGSGLGPDGQHATASEDMWLSELGAPAPTWIQYDFDRTCKLHEMRVWNYNIIFEGALGYGLRNVTVEYSENGTDWIVLGDFEFAQATSRSDYTANTTIDFGGKAVRGVKLTVGSNWGGAFPQYGLSEVRFLYVPAHAREPQPAVDMNEVTVGAVLGWRAGREADLHEVYLSTNEQTVIDGTVPVSTVVTNSFAPTNLEFATDYYWKVNEVNEVEAISVWEGTIWHFATQEFATIDDFESYDDEENRIYNTWLDGWVNDTGSTVGYLEAPFTEQKIVNSGRHSMPLAYDNSDTPMYSEAEYALGGMQLDGNGANSLRLFIAGRAPGFVENADGTILMNGIGTDIWDTADQFRYAYMSLTGNGSMVARVDSLDASPDVWVKAGVMIRQGTGTGSHHSFMCITGSGGNGASWQGRVEQGQTSENRDAGDVVAAPYWVRIDRSGNTCTGFLSSDGQTWTQLSDPREVVMTDPVLIGLAVTSHNADQATSIQFSNVSFAGNVTGTWQVAEIGVAQPEGNTPEPVYVAVEDSAGNVAVVTHPDATLVARSGWTEWVVPYSELTGINLADTETLYVGIGNRNNPTSGGQGMIFIDKVGFGRPASHTVEEQTTPQ